MRCAQFKMMVGILEGTSCLCRLLGLNMGLNGEIFSAKEASWSSWWVLAPSAGIFVSAIGLSMLNMFSPRGELFPLTITSSLCQLLGVGSWK